MKRRVPLAVIFAIALAIAAVLPLYIERTMTEVMFADGSGGRIDWAWKRCTLRDYWSLQSHSILHFERDLRTVQADGTTEERAALRIVLTRGRRRIARAGRV